MTSSTKTALPERAAVPAQDKWNVAALYPSLQEWEKAFLAACEAKTPPYWPSLAAFKGHLHEGADKVKQLLDLSFSIARMLDKLHTYAHLRHDEEVTEEGPKQAYQRISSLYLDFQQESAWIEPELLALPPEKMKEYASAYPLRSYHFYLSNLLRMQPHTLSGEKEEIIAMANKPLQAIAKAFSALDNADIKLEEVTDSKGKKALLTHGLYQSYLRSRDRTLRQDAFFSMHRAFLNHENTLAELLFGEVQRHLFQARVHHYSSSLEAALFPHHIPLSVYRSLITSVRAGLPALHHYLSVRKKKLGLQELHPYDLYVPLVGDVEIEIGYEEAEALVIESAAPLGAEYQNILRRGLLHEGWVDRYENKHKRSGAYSSGCYDSFPYLLMNFRGTLRDTFTLAHEAGHSMHSYLTNQTQPYHYARYPIFLAEVASTFHEELLHHLLLQKLTGEKEHLFLINEKVEAIRATLFRQTLFAEFELLVHEWVEAGIPLTPSLLKEGYRKLNREYFGEEVVLDAELDIEWARIPHFYYNFYVYQYATGISAALSLARRVLSEGKEARDRYLKFLCGGASHYPVSLLAEAGVDVTKPTPVKETIDLFASLVSALS